jgi:hypothetical protein
MLGWTTGSTLVFEDFRVSVGKSEKLIQTADVLTGGPEGPGGSIGPQADTIDHKLGTGLVDVAGERVSRVRTYRRGPESPPV